MWHNINFYSFFSLKIFFSIWNSGDSESFYLLAIKKETGYLIASVLPLYYLKWEGPFPGDDA